MKPANVIIDERTDRALVADFGLAKVLGSDQSATQTGAVMGTPAYMSPEQTQDRLAADRDGRRLQHRGDAVSPAHRSAALSNAFDRRDDSPSQRGRTGRAATAEPGGQLRLGNDLLEVLGERTAAALRIGGGGRTRAVAILERGNRFQLGRSVPLRSAGRWARKHPAVAALSSISLLLAVGLLTTFAIGYFTVAGSLERESRARKDADAKAELARENLQQAFEAANEAYTKIASDTGLRRFGLESMRAAMLRDVLPFLESFAKQAPDNREYQAALAVALRNLAEVTHAMGDDQAADGYINRSVELLERLRRTETTPELERYYAQALSQRGRQGVGTGNSTVAFADLEEALAVLEKLHQGGLNREEIVLGRAVVHANLAVAISKRRPEAVAEIRKHFEAAIGIREEYRKQSEVTAVASHNLAALAETYTNFGVFYIRMGDAVAAEERFAQTAEIFREHGSRLANFYSFRPTLAALGYELGVLAEAKGDYASAEASLAEAHKAAEQLAGVHPRVPAFRFRLVKCKIAVAVVGMRLDRPDDVTKAHLDQADQLLAELIEQDDRPDYQLESSVLQTVLYRFHGRRKDRKRQQAALQKSLEIRRQLVLENPTNAEMRRFLGEAHFNRGVFFDEGKDVVNAETEFLAAAKVWRELLEDVPNYRSAAVELTDALHNLSVLYIEQDRTDAFDALMAELNPLLSSLPKSDPQIVLNLGRLRLGLGERFVKAKKNKQALAYLSAAAESFRDLLKIGKNENASILLASALMSRAEIHGQNDDVEAGKKDWSEALSHAPSATQIELQLKRAAWMLRYAKPTPPKSEQDDERS